MTRTVSSPVQAPGLIRGSNGLANRLLQAGMPMGPNTLMTVRGRKTGEPRTAPVAVIDVGGRRFVLAAYGPVNWVWNLRAAGEAVVRLHGRDEHLQARELDHDQAVTFFTETVPAYIAHFPWFGRAFARIFFRIVGPELRDDPQRAADLHPVFELTPAA